MPNGDGDVERAHGSHYVGKNRSKASNSPSKGMRLDEKGVQGRVDTDAPLLYNLFSLQRKLISLIERGM